MLFYESNVSQRVANNWNYYSPRESSNYIVSYVIGILHVANTSGNWDKSSHDWYIVSKDNCLVSIFLEKYLEKWEKIEASAPQGAAS